MCRLQRFFPKKAVTRDVKSLSLVQDFPAELSCNTEWPDSFGR